MRRTSAQLFDTGVIKFSDGPTTTVPLGEIRSDDDNHLLVLGGFGKSASPPGSGFEDFWGNDDWYDDASDGPVTATIRIRASGSTPAVVGAWVIVGPPKFAPHQDSVITLYDRVRQVMVTAGLATAPTTTSVHAGRVSHPAACTRYEVGGKRRRRALVGGPSHERSRAPSDLLAPESAVPAAPSDMPDLNGSDGRLTQVQYDHMTRWKDGNFTNDWVGVPAP